MKIAVNAGHTIKGKGTGAVGYLNESEETRKIANEVMKLLSTNHKIVDATVDRSYNYLYDVAKLVNESNAELFISIHLNAGKGTGCEVYTWNGEKHKYATGICEELSKLGFKNRGVKDGSGFYVIRKTKMTAMIIEVCFVDLLKDVELYKKVGVKKIAEAIVKGLLR